MPLSIKRPFRINAPLFFLLKRVNFNGKVSNKRISHKGERNYAYFMKMLYLYPMEVYNFELRFSENVIQKWLYFSFISCSVSHNTLAISPDSLRVTYFPGTTKPILAALVLLELIPTKSSFLFYKFVHFEINAPLN